MFPRAIHLTQSTYVGSFFWNTWEWLCTSQMWQNSNKTTHSDCTVRHKQNNHGHEIGERASLSGELELSLICTSFSSSLFWRIKWIQASCFFFFSWRMLCWEQIYGKGKEEEKNKLLEDEIFRNTRRRGKVQCQKKLQFYSLWKRE